jgi:hypothetical protein
MIIGIRRAFVALVVFLGCTMVLPAAAATGSKADQDAVVHVLKHAFEQPQSPLRVRPVVVSGDHAIASWIQDQRGGRALLQRKHGTWRVVLCSGEALRHPDILVQAGLTPADAKRLSDRLSQAEAGMPKATRRLFDSFEGTVMIEDGHGHGHGAGHGK